MHCVVKSAMGLRDQRLAETFLRLNTVARRLAAAEGLSSFTVEQVCDEAGVSRRTFFNHFASKEDAVLGVWLRNDHDEAEEAFVWGTRALIDDLAELLVARWELMQLTAADARELWQAFGREPRLLARVLELTRVQEVADIALVERREHLPAGDLRAAIVVQLMGAVLRGSVEATLEAQSDQSVRAVFTERLAVARKVFSA